MNRSLLRPIKRFSTQSPWRKFQEYKNTDTIEWIRMSFGQKLIHIIRSTGYFAIIVSGIGVMGMALNEVIKSTNESNLSWDIFDDAKRRIIEHGLVRKTFGMPIVAHAQDSSDARIRNSLGIQKEAGGERLWMSFVISSSRGKGYVTVEKFKKNGSAEYEYVTLIVNAPFAHQSIPIIDNRPPIFIKRVIPNLGERLVDWLKSSCR